MSLVLDASAAVAALVDVGERGRWARRMLSQRHLMAPHLMHAEVTNRLRRLVSGGSIAALTATVAMRDLADLGTELYAFEPFADRVWALRETVTAYDAWYVALAEAYDVPLATLDRRLAGASGPQCDFATPDQRGG